ncbi:glucose-6-phosphate dehydrogenase [Hesseltinella vesiculosa]|uniref:Glucose-6-phosphate 1-dehydrogenase n=1 Tax=Hesseltinella vesiculosa TaxID=101127 RepID=A0A1X2GH98_9FUNG|nr:glucose-6-phosphate dehydrogenase [Hesseltinella vesiculosa]
MPNSSKRISSQAVHDHMHGGVTVIVFGASGDLAKKKTFPALYRLFKNARLPVSTKIIGYARSHLEDQAFHEKVVGYLGKDEDPKTVQDFFSLCSYVSGKYDEDDSFINLDNFITASEDSRNMQDNQRNRLFYMALPPSVFLDVARGCSKHLVKKDTASLYPIIIEKPFGKSLPTCNQLLKDMSGLFQESDTYRIDHYLGKEMVKNIMTVRFANVLLSPLWNNQHISSVQITFKENFGTEGRGGYFDEFGIIRDVMQNHLLQVLSLLAMERPIGRDGEAIRDEKVKLLRCVKPITLEDTLVGQYVGNNSGKPGYQDDDTVPKGSRCPTFALTTLWIDNERWDGVPFIMKAGKAMERSKVEVRVQFKKVPGSLFGGVSRNELVLRIQPNEAIYLKFNNKRPGLSSETLLTDLDLTYQERYENMRIPEAYESLILDVLKGDHSNFVRDDELQAAWTIFDGMLNGLEEQEVVPKPYTYGSRGPAEESAFLQRLGVVRQNPGYTWPKQDIDEEE